MARFSIGEDDEDAVIVKRARFAEPASQSQPPVSAGEDEVLEDLIPIEDVESDSQESEEEEDEEEDESEAEAADEDDEEEEGEEEDAASEEDDVQPSEVQPVSDEQNRPASRSMRLISTPPPVFNNAIGSLQVVLTDPDVLDCPICLDPLSTPVFQCENGHIACSSCCNKVKRKCPSCCMPIGYNRCRAIEKVLESIKISCKNARHGCKETIAYSKKIEHEQTCPHTICYCPNSSCPFTGSSKNLYLHFGIQHAASTTRFTYNTTFTLTVGLNQKHIFLQEQNESVIFILNHEVKPHGRVFNVDCVGPSTFKTSFSYQLTVKHSQTSLALQSVPEIYAKWSEHNPRKNYLTAPTEFVSFNGLMSLHVCIKKAV